MVRYVRDIVETLFTFTMYATMSVLYWPKTGLYAQYRTYGELLACVS